VRVVISPYKVFAIVDRSFGEKLLTLPERVPVWIVNTVVNKPMVERLWQERAAENHLTGITAFNDTDSASSEDILIARLKDIDMHHGIYSATPPYTILEVVGTHLSARLKSEMKEYGFDDFRETGDGFIAMRPEPQNQK
jgi:hypothetical protein